MIVDYPLFAAPFSHIFLTIYNILVYLAGVILLVGGCFLNGLRFLLYDIYMDSFALSLMLLVIIGLTAGVLLVDLSFNKGSFINSSCQVIGLSLLMLMICTAELSAFISGTLLRNEIEYKTKKNLRDQVSNYNYDINSTANWMDFIQPELECCGIESALDWKMKYGDQQLTDYPDSCCQKKHHFVGCGKNESLIYTRSCMEIFLHWIHYDVLIFASVCFVLCLMQILGLIGLCLVQDEVESKWKRVKSPV